MVAIKSSGLLQLIDLDLRTPELCVAAVIVDVWAYHYIPNKYRSPQIRQIIEKHPDVLNGYSVLHDAENL